nr:polyprenyl synthetase family protein [Corynebacterium lactis]
MSDTDHLAHLSPREIPAAVTASLRSYFEERKVESLDIDPVCTSVIDSLETFVLNGGKRVRPAFAWQGWLGAGGAEGTFAAPEDPQRVLRAVSSLELIQACALIHDDIIDDADTRRGAPTIHKTYERLHAENHWRGTASRYGISTAILTGDVALAWADDMLHSSGLSPEAVSRALVPWRAMRTEVLGGQLLDITAEASRDGRVETAQKINRYKTAAYTTERPLHIGAAIAGAPESIISAYRSFGRDIGVAFQLRDDQLGVFGDPEVTGKPAGDDLREGKRTVLVGTALEIFQQSAPDKARFIEENLGNVTSVEDIDQLRDLIEQSGAADEVEREIDRLSQRAFEALRTADIPEDNRENLIDMGVRATARQS